ncbi:Arm DNA-binding domain-containing protein [Aeromonas caviae]|uniref:Arm DNA-binding domain-containing protein n=1 Tax=Aeromonas caviae TaxID=648 RepID=UPI000C9E54B5|nr:Arm DNA-binding domain-containing protein [Aeromonas caviae]PNO58602.1 hypothetical protein MC65_009440 [Aeromonas caviae]
MQTKFRFTNAAIKALPAQQREAGATELEFSDTEVIGLKLLSGKSQGSKRFLLRYTLQGKKRSIALGRFGDIDVSQARTIARKYKAMLAEGIDPVAERDSYNRHSAPDLGINLQIALTQYLQNDLLVSC